MYREVLHQKKRSSWSTILLIICIVGAIILITAVSNILKNKLNIQYLEYAIYLIAVVAAFYFLRFRVMEYVYSVDEKIVYVDRLFGIREKRLEEIPFKYIDWFGQYKDMPECNAKMVSLTFFDKSTAHVIIYSKSGSKYALCFHPSDQLVSRLEFNLKGR